MVIWLVSPMKLLPIRREEVEVVPRTWSLILELGMILLLLFIIIVSFSVKTSIILFNPNLLDVYPTTEEQLKLFNNFCKILKFKTH